MLRVATARMAPSRWPSTSGPCKAWAIVQFWTTCSKNTGLSGTTPLGWRAFSLRSSCPPRPAGTASPCETFLLPADHIPLHLSLILLRLGTSMKVHIHRAPPEPWPAKRGRIRHRWLLPLWGIEWALEWVAFALSRWTFLAVLEYL